MTRTMKQLILIFFIGISYCVCANNSGKMAEFDQTLGVVSDSICFNKIDSIFYDSVNESDSIYCKLNFYNYSDSLFIMRNQHVDMDSSVWIAAYEVDWPDSNYYLVIYNGHKYLVPKYVTNNIVTSANKTLHISYPLKLTDVLTSIFFPVILLKESNGNMKEYDRSTDIYMNYVE